MWILPSYKRPEQCRAVLQQIISVGCETPGILFVQSGEAEYQDMEIPKGWQRILMSHNVGLCRSMNYVFEQFPKEPFYGLICDDEYVFTPGWDKRLLEASGSWNIAHGNDGWQSSRRIHTYATWGGDLIRTVGWWALPGLWHWYFDDVWEKIADECGLRRFCYDVKTEHKHYLSGKVPKDDTYLMGEARSQEDQWLYSKFMANDFLPLTSLIKSRMGQ